MAIVSEDKRLQEQRTNDLTTSRDTAAGTDTNAAPDFSQIKLAGTLGSLLNGAGRMQQGVDQIGNAGDLRDVTRGVQNLERGANQTGLGQLLQPKAETHTSTQNASGGSLGDMLHSKTQGGATQNTQKSGGTKTPTATAQAPQSDPNADIDPDTYGAVNKALQNGGATPRHGSQIPSDSPLGQFAKPIVDMVKTQIVPQIMGAIEKEFGPMAPVRTGNIQGMQGVDKDGKPVNGTYQGDVVQPVQDLSSQENQKKMAAVLKSPEFKDYLANLSSKTDIKGVKLAQFDCEVFRGEDAKILIEEKRGMVAMKRGKWAELPEGATAGDQAVNCVAIRGEDFSNGLKASNSNKVMDDTAYFCIEKPGNDYTVLRVRCTTESSSSEYGVARMLANQTEQRLFHADTYHGDRGCFRPRGNFVEAERNGQSGTSDAPGVLIHCGFMNYNSNTPLPTNVSLGCTAMDGKDEVFKAVLMKAVGRSEFPFTLYDNGEAHAYLDAVHAAGGRSPSLDRKN